MNNIEKNHAAMVNGNSKSGEDILNSMSHSDMHLLHMAVGICGEAGELLDAIKKACVYNKPLDRENSIEELGDIEFYLHGIRAGLNVSRDEVLQANIDKLEKRYPKGYTDKAAQDRVDKAWRKAQGCPSARELVGPNGDDSREAKAWRQAKAFGDLA